MGFLLLGAAQALPITTPAATVEARERAPVTVPVTLSNPTAQVQTETLALDLPPGWSLLAGERTLTLGAGETRTELFTLIPPSMLTAGVTEVAVRSSDARAVWRFGVRENRMVRVQTLEVPEYNTSGSYVVRWRLTNTGNTPEWLTLDVMPVELARVKLDSDALRLAPGESRDVTGSVTAKGVAKLEPLALRLRVRLGGGRQVFALARTNLIPRQEELPLSARYQTFPVTLSFGALVSPAEASGTFRLSGQGQLVQGDPGSFSFALSQDALTLRYERDDYAWTAGRFAAGVSPLVPSVAATGAEGRLVNGGQALHAFVGTTLDGAVTAGAALGWRGEAAGASVGLQETAGQVIASAKAEVATTEIKADGAFAIDPTSGAYAAKFHATLVERWGSADASYGRSSRGWLGRAEDTQSVRASLTGQPSKDLSFGAFAGVNGVETPRLSFGANVRGRSAYGTFAAQYTLTPGAQQLQAAFAQPLPNGTLNHNASVTYRRADGDTLAQYTTTASFNLPHGKVSPMVGLGLNTRTMNPIWMFGLGGTFAASPDLALAYQISSADLARGQLSAALNAHYAVNKTAQLTLDATAQRSNGAWSAGVRLGGQVKFDLPVHERRDIARLSGQIVDSAGRGLANIILRAGDTATVTNATGHYVFSALPIGPVTLTTLVQSFEQDVVLDPALPMTLTLTCQEARVLNIRAVRTARITGKVDIRLPQDGVLSGGGVLPEVPDLTKLTLLLTGPQETGSAETVRKTIPAADGTFVFSQLLPGTYRLTLSPETSALLARHEMTLPGPVTLDGGQTVQLSVDVMLKPRPLRIDTPQDLTPTGP